MSSINQEDLEPIIEQVQRFVAQQIQPIVVQHEVPATAVQVNGVLETALCMQGHYGLARYSLAKYLQGQPLKRM